MQDYHQLDVWNRAMDYTAAIYEFSAQLPSDERFNLVAQIRKAAISVPLNIAEGSGCTTNPEFARFVGYGYRSLKELSRVSNSVKASTLFFSVHGTAHRRRQPDLTNDV